MRSSPPIERLVAALKRLPGIGEKSATRLAFFLLGAPDAVVQELSSAIGRLKQEIVLCEVCFDLTDHSPCAVCRDPRRDTSVIESTGSMLRTNHISPLTSSSLELVDSTPQQREEHPRCPSPTTSAGSAWP